ncbi:MAG: hypothetical protein JJU46_08225 [Balneolaceae bacterium]|nr:hypothetical protein [Balneolaceae bacterium]MCH8547897.1 hypothetical protein [Balneolaceae bacterium]
MIIDSIHHQQLEKVARNNGLRAAAGSPKPPELSSDETGMIERKFSTAKPLTQYTSGGDVKESAWPVRGSHFDVRV